MTPAITHTHTYLGIPTSSLCRVRSSYPGVEESCKYYLYPTLPVSNLNYHRACAAIVAAYSSCSSSLLLLAVSSRTRSSYSLLIAIKTLSPITQIVILVVLSFSNRRKSVCLECCNGRPGLYSCESRRYNVYTSMSSIRWHN